MADYQKNSQMKIVINRNLDARLFEKSTCWHTRLVTVHSVLSNTLRDACLGIVACEQ